MNNVSNMTAAELFQKKFNACKTQVVFNTDWKNGTGYLNGAVKADLGLQPEQWVKCEDDLDRRVLIGRFGDEGNIVIFERYSPKAADDRSNIIVSNIPGYVTQMVKNEEAEKCLDPEHGIGSSLRAVGIEWLTCTLKVN